MSTAAGYSDFCSPLERRIPGGYVDDSEAADEVFILRVRAVGYRSIGGHHARLPGVPKPTGKDKHTRVFGLLDHRTRGLRYVRQFLLREVIAPSLNEIKYRVIS